MKIRSQVRKQRFSWIKFEPSLNPTSYKTLTVTFTHPSPLPRGWWSTQKVRFGWLDNTHSAKMWGFKCWASTGALVFGIYRNIYRNLIWLGLHGATTNMSWHVMYIKIERINVSIYYQLICADLFGWRERSMRARAIECQFVSWESISWEALRF